MSIHTIDELSPDALTLILKEAGALPHGNVQSIRFQNVAVPLSGRQPTLFHLSIQYRDTADARPPQQLFFKVGKSSKEHYFYTHIAQELPASLLPRCFYTGYDDATGLTCLLLEDLEATYFQTEYPLPPPLPWCEATVQELAKIHACFWNDPRLETVFRPAIATGRAWTDRLSLAVQSIPAFLDFLGDRLAPDRKKIYQQIYQKDAAFLQFPPVHQTLIHGDLHFWNVLFPRSPGKDTLRFIDWNMWDISRPTDDLAYLIALHWFPERRSRFEKRLLDLYFSALGECGITDTSRADLWQDYGVSLIRNLLIPVWQWTRGIQPIIWWLHLERGWMAFEDSSEKNLL